MSLGIMHQLPEFVRGHRLATVPAFTAPASEASAAEARDDNYESLHVPTDRAQDAHVVTSRANDGKYCDHHRPVLDIDFPAALIPSTTPGHFHLYLDKPMPWGKYKALLKALADAGIIERGYLSASIGRQYTSVRLPWVRKVQLPS